MTEPSFSETVQIGIVVRELEMTMRRYVEEYGTSAARSAA
jgi:hypothetical protein